MIEHDLSEAYATVARLPVNMYHKNYYMPNGTFCKVLRPFRRKFSDFNKKERIYIMSHGNDWSICIQQYAKQIENRINCTIELDKKQLRRENCVAVGSITLQA